MKSTKLNVVLATLLLALLLTYGVTLAFSKSAANIPIGWQQVNENGFGETTNVGVTSLEIFDGQLYAGVTNWGDGGRVFRTGDGSSWTPVSEIRFGSNDPDSNLAIVDLIEFNDQLYAGTGWGLGNPIGQIWRTQPGTWEQVVGDGFGDANNNGVTAFTIFNNTLYAGTGNDVNGLQIWKSNTGDSLSWTNVITEGFGYATNRNVTSFYEFNDDLYAAVESNLVFGPAQVWRTSNGTNWTSVTTNGFNDPNNYSTGGLAAFEGFLYLGTRNDVTGGQLWRSDDGTNWNKVIGDGFGDNNNVKIESLFVFEDLLYAITFNQVTGMEVWRSIDGMAWDQVNADGFGNSNNYATLWSNASVIFDDNIYVGTWNDIDGGEIWTTLRRLYLPLVINN